MTDSIAAPNWYPDPNERGTERWWDGHTWTERTRRQAVAQATTQTGDVSEPPVKAAIVVPRPQPDSGPTTVMLVIGIILFVIGWILIGTAATTSTSDTLLNSDIVNIPSLVTKTAGGLLVALLGATLLGAAMVRRHIAAWAGWSQDAK